MPSTIGKCKLFSRKHITLLEGETFLRKKHEIVVFEIKCTLIGRKENTITIKSYAFTLIFFFFFLFQLALLRWFFYPQPTTHNETHHVNKKSVLWCFYWFLLFFIKKKKRKITRYFLTPKNRYASRSLFRPTKWKYHFKPFGQKNPMKKNFKKFFNSCLPPTIIFSIDKHFCCIQTIRLFLPVLSYSVLCMCQSTLFKGE